MTVSPEAQASMDALRALREERMTETTEAKKLVSYKVYEAEGPFGDVLKFIEKTEAANDIKAIAKVIGESTEGSYVAIPQRSLKVRTVSSVSVPKVTIS